MIEVRTQSLIQGVSQSCGCLRRRLRTNCLSFFDGMNPLDPATAWVFGLLLTDGNLHVRDNANGGRSAQLTLKMTDEDVIRKVRDIVAPHAVVKVNISSQHKPAFVFHIGCLGYVAQLEKYGICQRKSMREVAHPEFQHNANFWRGVLEGDGCLWSDKRGRPGIQLVGSKTLCESFRTYVKKLTECNKLSRVVNKGVGNDMFVFRVARRRIVTEICKTLWSSAPKHIRMARKYNLAAQFATA